MSQDIIKCTTGFRDRLIASCGFPTEGDLNSVLCSSAGFKKGSERERGGGGGGGEVDRRDGGWGGGGVDLVGISVFSSHGFVPAIHLQSSFCARLARLAC